MVYGVKLLGATDQNFVITQNGFWRYVFETSLIERGPEGKS